MPKKKTINGFQAPLWFSNVPLRIFKNTIIVMNQLILMFVEDRHWKSMSHTFIFQIVHCVCWKLVEGGRCKLGSRGEVPCALRTGCQGSVAANTPDGWIIQKLFRMRHFLQQRRSWKIIAIFLFCLWNLDIKTSSWVQWYRMYPCHSGAWSERITWSLRPVWAPQRDFVPKKHFTPHL